MRLFGVSNQQIDALQELFAGALRAGQDQVFTIGPQQFLLGRPRPAAQVAVHHEREPAEVLSPSRGPEIAEDIFETQPQACRVVHVALQHTSASASVSAGN